MAGERASCYCICMMRRQRKSILFLLGLIFLGAGCWPFGRETAYIEAPELPDITVPPTLEGARASTGGQEATITPELDTALLVAALPSEARGCALGETREQRHPVPLPDGTRSEYVSVERELLCDTDPGKNILLSISDTRGIPVLTAFFEAFQGYSSNGSRRFSFPVEDETGWVTYTDDATGQKNGVGSMTMLYRKRFLLQIDSSGALNEQELIDLARAFRFAKLR